jgi:CRP-like cAMP-binding protein/thioredoxin reductase/Fe-S-cluster-containing hydrogenase component 2
VTSTYKVAIVGSGPAGLSAAARAAQLGMSHILLEKTDHLSDTIFRYQKGKHVMATPSQLVLRSDFDFDAGKREKILQTWNDQAASQNVQVRYRSEVTAISGAPGAFTLQLADGESINAEAVILAIGTQGNPNLMRCPGGDLLHVEYQLDDPTAILDEHITVIGAGDAGIENALGLAADPEQRNVVTIVNRSADFSRAKDANVKALTAAAEEGRINILTETSTNRIEPDHIVLDTRDGELRIPCNRIIARMGSAPPRGFVESCGIEFSSKDREAFPILSPVFESTASGIFVIGALAGYPLIKHCMNHGYDVVEFINGNTNLKPADEPILEAKFSKLPGKRSVDEWLDLLRKEIDILRDLTPLQMREFTLDSDVSFVRKGDVIFDRGAPGSSLFNVASGGVHVQVNPNDPSIVVPIGAGAMFGEVGLISGRKRGATVVAAEDSVLMEIPRNAALKLIATVPAVKRAVTRVSIERQLLQLFKAGLSPSDIAEVVESAETISVRAGESIIAEGDESYDIYVIRVGSMVVERTIAGKTVFISYLPAGSYVGEMALIEGGRRTASVRAAVKSEVIKLNGDAFRSLLERNSALLERLKVDMATRKDVNAHIETMKSTFSDVADMYSSVASFLVENGIGEATDVLLIDERLCVGCDNCEKACADSHDGLSRLDREAGKTYAHLHVPTSCRHCEHPHCMADCPPNAIHRGMDGEVFIDDTCIGCGNCQRACPYGVIRMDKVPPKKPPLLNWLLFGSGPGPGEPNAKWAKKHGNPEAPKKAIKCDMCAGIEGGPSCVRACPTGAAIRISPEQFLSVSHMQKGS